MKKLCIVIICALCMTGCSATETVETVADDLVVSADAVASQVALSFPEDHVASVFEGEDGSALYLCENFAVSVQILEGGDLGETVHAVTGFSKDSLTVMHTERNGVASYECAWSTAGETEDQVCRAVILDDGTYHYAVTVMAGYTQAGELNETWQEVLNSVALSTG